MNDQETSTLSRRRFLQGSAAAAGVLGLLQDGLPPGAEPAGAGQPPKGKLPKRPNFLVLMCDEMRFPPIYESEVTKAFRQQFLQVENLLRQNGADFGSTPTACRPSAITSARRATRRSGGASGTPPTRTC